MQKNRLQLALERVKRSRAVIDLTATSFHAAGLRFPSTPLSHVARTYFFARNYQPDPRGEPPAREAISEYYLRAGVEIPADRILITASSSESYNLLFSTLAEHGDDVLLPSPGYPLFEELARYSRVEPRFYRLDPRRAYRPDLHSIRRLINDRTRFLVVISPGNPTGQLVSAEDMASLAQLCANHRIGLIHDEVFAEQVYTATCPGAGSPDEGAPEEGSPDKAPPDKGPPAGSEGQRGRETRSAGTRRSSRLTLPATLPRAAAARSAATVYTLNGVSKMFAAPELKLGWIAVRGAPGAAEGAYRELELANDTFLSCSGFSQAVLPAMFATGVPFQRCMRAHLEANRDLLQAYLGSVRGVSLLPPAGGIHCILRIDPVALKRNKEDEDLAVELLEREAVYLHPGYFYRIEDGTAFVLSILKHPDELEEGLARLARFLSA